MMFTNPVPNGKISNLSSSKKRVYVSNLNDRVNSPYDGIIKKVDTSECGGMVEIDHIIDGNKVTSQICQVKRPTVFPGSKVRQNEIIGFVGDTPVEFIILDKFNDKMKIDDFFIEKKEDIKKDITDKTKVDDKKVKKITDNPVLYDAALDLMIFPFTLAGSALKGEKLKEEIKRIKKLL